ncbi:cell division cycle 20.5, cofactor of APC complex-like isoform X2 [Acanthaster planci]|uniref:Cell division cycle 20.5, cofactor of APC complex-like isoform X2 n=1 Tax=Acanthaster planci TaxID=133434 RepID=A0A8B7Y6E1_ACAPL|nr:cell division cycle 20.5, cofactor of APC complex-like isoform X2 [Acanthaster planci]
MQTGRRALDVDYFGRTWELPSLAMIGIHQEQQRGRAGSFDRFIPARDRLNFAAASYEVSPTPGSRGRADEDGASSQDVFFESKSEANNSDSVWKFGESQADYQQRMALLAEGVVCDKVFAFRPRQRSGSWSGYRDVATSKLPCRKLPPSPTHALEVNALNTARVGSSQLFDINSRGQLAMLLGRQLHVLELGQADVRFKSFTVSSEPAGRDDAHHTPCCVRWSPTGRAVAVCAQALLLFDPELGRITASSIDFSPSDCLDWSRHCLSASRLSAVNTLRYSTDGGMLACGTADGKVVMWDVRHRGKPQHELDAHSDGVGAMAWCPLKPWYVTTGGKASDQTIRIWNVYTGILNKSIMVGSEVTSLAWCEQSSELVSSHGTESGEANIRVWKSPKMHLVGEMRRHEGRVFQVGLTPDGSKLISVGNDEILCVWDFYHADAASLASPLGTAHPRRRSSTFNSPGKSPGAVTSPLALGGLR